MLPDAVGRCLRTCVICANVVQLVAALTLFSFAIWTIIDKAEIDSILGSNLYLSSAYVLSASSIALIFLAALSAYGATKEIRWLLLSHCVLALIAFVVLFMGAVLAYVFRSQVDLTMELQLHDAIQQHYSFRSAETRTIDAIQLKFQCCSSDANYNLTQWMHSLWYEAQPDPPRALVPESCCVMNRSSGAPLSLTECQGRDSPLPLSMSRLEGEGWPNRRYVNVDTCLEPAKALIRQHALSLAVIATGTSVILLISIVLAFLLYMKISD